MPATLQQIQFKLHEVEALRADAADNVARLALGRMESDAKTRLEIVSKWQAYEREFLALVTIERELIANGRSADVPSALSRLETGAPQLRIETRFDAPPPSTAVATLTGGPDAQNMARIGPRSDAAESFASGDAF